MRDKNPQFGVKRKMFNKALRGQMTGGLGNIFGLVLVIIFVVNLVIPTVINANTTGMASNDVTLFKTIVTIVVVGLIAYAARALGLVKIARLMKR